MTSTVDTDERVRPASSGSVLRWMGSKKKTAEAIVGHLPQLDADATYFEPFFGGGSVFFAYRPHRSVLGDSNAALMNAWRWIREAGDEVWRGVASLDVTPANYYNVRASREEAGTRDDAIRFVYLNRHCFNGIYRTNRRDEFNVPFGRNTGAVPQRQAFALCAEILNSSTLRVGDFVATLEDARAGDVVYLDPPWQSARATYGVYGYTPHLDVTPERVLEAAADLSSRGVATFISLPKSVANVFSDWPTTGLDVHYRVASKHAARSRQTELLVTVGPAHRGAGTK